MALVLETTLGDITIDLFANERPKACLNFLKLCKMKYYNFNLFHTIQHDFLAQTGDPTGAGTGGESIWGVIDGPLKRYFEGEDQPKIRHTNVGTVSLVSSGNNMLGSQFFITLAPDLISLDGKHCVIGEVAEGLDILRKLNEAICDEEYRPYQDIRITHTVILEDPFPDPDRFHEPPQSPEPTAERLQNGRIGADEEIDETVGKTAEELAEMAAEREAQARATILEMVGDIPDADMAPPENVLFVCKLNPVTTDDDLEIIFSRFGKIKSCEVIRDKQSGDSLQYAFVEFEERKSCEDAYFKMDNVLIDDRRIHVDFSQSVAKVKWLGKGRGVKYYDSGKKRDKDIAQGDYKIVSTEHRLHKKEKTEPSRNKNYDERNTRERRNYRDEKQDRYRKNNSKYDDKSIRGDKHYERSRYRNSYDERSKYRDWSNERSRYGDRSHTRRENYSDRQYDDYKRDYRQESKKRSKDVRKRDHSEDKRKLDKNINSSSVKKKKYVRDSSSDSNRELRKRPKESSSDSEKRGKKNAEKKSKKKKKKKAVSSSESSSDETRKKKKNKKRRDTSSDSSNSSTSESSDDRNKRKKIRKSKK